MKKIIFILIVFGIVISAFTQDEIPMNYLLESVSHETDAQMKKGSKYIIDFYKSINFPIKITKIDLRVFSSFDEYKSHQKLNSNARSDNGYFSISKQEIILFDNDRILKTFNHEFNHYLLRSNFKSPPKWINEGLSEYFEFINIADSCYVLPQKKKIARIKNWIGTGLDNDIEQILIVSNEQWSKQNIEPEYRSSTISYAIVLFLMSNKDSELIIGEIINKLMNEEKSVDIISNLYPGGFVEFKNNFIKFYKEWNL